IYVSNQQALASQQQHDRDNVHLQTPHLGTGPGAASSSGHETDATTTAHRPMDLGDLTEIPGLYQARLHERNQTAQLIQQSAPLSQASSAGATPGAPYFAESMEAATSQDLLEQRLKLLQDGAVSFDSKLKDAMTTGVDKVKFEEMLAHSEVFQAEMIEQDRKLKQERTRLLLKKSKHHDLQASQQEEQEPRSFSKRVPDREDSLDEEELSMDSDMDWLRQTSDPQGTHDRKNR
ncbi:unnamed protein product, partial [Amoebophrya sp. A120]